MAFLSPHGVFSSFALFLRPFVEGSPLASYELHGLKPEGTGPFDRARNVRSQGVHSAPPGDPETSRGNTRQGGEGGARLCGRRGCTRPAGGGSQVAAATPRPPGRPPGSPPEEQTPPRAAAPGPGGGRGGGRGGRRIAGPLPPSAAPPAAPSAAAAAAAGARPSILGPPAAAGGGRWPGARRGAAPAPRPQLLGVGDRLRDPPRPPSPSRPFPRQPRKGGRRCRQRERGAEPPGPSPVPGG